MKRSSVFHTVLIMMLDAILVAASGGLAILLRSNFALRLVLKDVETWLSFLPVQIVLTLGIFFLTKMYRYMWRSVGASDVLGMIGKVCLAYGVCVVAARLCNCLILSWSIALLTLIFQIIFLVGIRCIMRIYASLRRILSSIDSRNVQQRIMLVGAGQAGHMLLREIGESDKVEGKVCCLIDDNERLWGKYLEGVRVYGGRDRIQALAERESITQIILAMPSASAAVRAELLQICKETGCRVRALPGLYQLMNGEVSMTKVKDVQMEDLLGRDPIVLDRSAMNAFLADKTVLVTGGGGSIGSELCRQIAMCKPKTLIILDIYENSTYELEQELRRTYKDALDLRVEIASVRDREKIFSLLAYYRPQVVFHAAAHKHVPLMESCPAEAIKNNIFGTYNVVTAAEAAGVEKFVMISTDKAVNPTNIMGATKRFGEMILQSRHSSTEFASVRFGNVLGSNGSVVPLFKRQIAEGGPVTITDKRIIRYFMTIPEAVQLVMEAGAMAKENQTFVLDMGEPVKILSMAENLIRQSGYVPYRDIDIKEVGLRPGEKLYEELLIATDGLTKTQNEKIFVDHQQLVSQEFIEDALAQLRQALEDKVPNEELKTLMKKLVPTYRSPEEQMAAAGK